MKNKKHKKRRHNPIPGKLVCKPKFVTTTAEEIEKILGMPHDEFMRAQAELVENGLIEIIDGDINEGTATLKLNFIYEG